MKNINHLAPIYRFYFAPWYRVGGRRAGYKLMIFNLCKGLISELKCDYEADFPFNPKHIPKVAQRRIRKACYQSFSLYKKSFKPSPKSKLKLKIYRDEWKTDDMVDAMLYALFQRQGMNRQDFENQYMCTWDLASDHTRDESVFMDVQL